MRSREYLTKDEVDTLLSAAKKMGKHGHRNYTLILLCYRHSLRVGEAIALRWDQFDLKQGTLHVNRLKNGVSSNHPLRGIELRALRQLHREYPNSPFLFQSQWRQPLSERSAHNIVAKAGELAGLPFPAHPHMLRHTTGYYLAAKDAFTQMGTYFFGKGMNAVADRASMESVLGEDGCNIYDYVVTTGGRPFVVTGQFVGIGSSDYVPVPIEFFSNWQELADNNNRDFGTRIRPPAATQALVRT